MTTKERTAQLVANVRAYLLSGWIIPKEWVGELFEAYGELQTVAATADAWRRAYNQVADSYRDLLASKSEVYLVDGHDAAYWARNCKLSGDNAAWVSNRYTGLRVRHEALSVEYLALRTKYDRLQQVVTNCTEELQDVLHANS